MSGQSEVSSYVNVATYHRSDGTTGALRPTTLALARRGLAARCLRYAGQPIRVSVARSSRAVCRRTSRRHEPSDRHPPRGEMTNTEIESWVADVAGRTKPAAVHWCDGRRGEADELAMGMLANGTLERLDEARYPRSFLHRSNPSDVARTENLTFICSKNEDDAGPTNNWMSPEEGFGENARVLKWAIDRISGRVASRQTPIGHVPRSGDLDLTGLAISRSALDALLSVDAQSWLAEIEQNEVLLRKFQDRLPSALGPEHRSLRERVGASIS